jgi:phage tail-like protein
MSPGSYYPPPSFYFQLQFTNISPGKDNAFQEATGLSVEWQLEEYREGGQNQYLHRLPTVAKYGNLVLKRGFVSATSPLATWCNASLAADFSTPIQPQGVTLTLFDADGNPLAVWSLLEAWPVKWSMSSFNAQANALAIETLEFAYSAFQRTT